MRHITIGAAGVALLAVGPALGRSSSQATAAIAPTQLVVTYAGVQQTPEDTVIVGEKTTPITIDPIESSGMPLGTSL